MTTQDAIDRAARRLMRLRRNPHRDSTEVSRTPADGPITAPADPQDNGTT